METVKEVSKKEQLKEWMRSKKIFATHEVIKWGINNFYNRAPQTKADLIREGLVRKLTPEEMKYQGFSEFYKEEVYCWIVGLLI
uniref:Uncharacterized protein n=1 Tax=viral metagenome TaxID=1070528 RepID=A0A6M3IWX0_9ZZZZ